MSELIGNVETQIKNGDWNLMRVNALMLRWASPLLGIALIGGGCLLVKSYLGFTQQIHSGEQFAETLIDLNQEVLLRNRLDQTGKGEPVAATRSLDEQLSANVAAMNARLDSADTSEKAFAEIVLAYLARHQSRHALEKDGSIAYRNEREVTGQKIPAATLASAYSRK